MNQQSLFCQRWRDTRGTYRPAGEVADLRRYEIAPITVNEAKEFVTTHHYSKSYPSCRRRFGLFDRAAPFLSSPALVGVAVFSTPMSAYVLTNVFPGDFRESVELGRFVLLDSVPANGETAFLSRCFELLRRESFIGVVAFSDDTPRTTATGDVVFPGHIGTIYQASNAKYLGRGTRRTLNMFSDGTIFSPRAISKIRNNEKGQKYAADILARYAGVDAGSHKDLAQLLETWLPRITRPLVHPGNHKYAFALNRQVPIKLTALLRERMYPKFGDNNHGSRNSN